MIVQCARCSTEFVSSHPHTHICPNCHFLFTEVDGEKQTPPELQNDAVETAPSSLIDLKDEGHKLFEEAVSKCSFHPDTDALAYCRQCGRPLCYACATEGPAGVLCEPCEQGMKPVIPEPYAKQEVSVGEQFEDDERRESVSKALKRGPYVPWEYRRQIGGFNAFFKTFRQSLFSPIRFFQKVPIVSDYQSPLLYGLYWTLVAIAAGMLWRIIFWGFPAVASLLRGDEFRLSAPNGQRALMGLFLFLIAPIIAAIILLAASLLYHIFVVLMTSRHAKFQSTLRVVCYSAGTNVFFLLPLIGALVGGIWQLVLVTIGLREMHRIVFPTAVAIALIPYTMLLVLCLAFTYWTVSGHDYGLLDFFTRQLMKLL